MQQLALLSLDVTLCTSNRITDYSKSSIQTMKTNSSEIMNYSAITK